VIVPGTGVARPSISLQRTAHVVEQAIELDAHLVSERPAGVVVGTPRNAALVHVVGVILRLEHVEHVRASGLRRLHDVRARGIGLAVAESGAVACRTSTPM
jgi:hypothetical protein